MLAEQLVLLFVFACGTALLTFWLYSRQRRSRDLLQARMQLQTRVLDRFESPQEFSAFLETVGGQKFLAGISDERGWRPARRIVNGVSIGLVLLTLGLPFFVLAAVESERRFAFPGVLAFCLGLGFLVASYASYKLSRAWGLMNGDRVSHLDVNDLTQPAGGER